MLGDAQQRACVWIATPTAGADQLVRQILIDAGLSAKDIAAVQEIPAEVSREARVFTITDRALEELRERTRQIKKDVEKTVVQIMVVDEQWRVVYMNRYARHYLARGNDLTGQVVWDAIPGLKGTVFESHARKAMRERTAGEMTGVCPTSRRWCEVSLHPSPEGLLICSRDIHKHKAEQQSARQSEHVYRRLFNNKLNGMVHGRIIVNEQGQPVDIEFLAANDAFERMTGLRKQAITGRQYRDIIADARYACFNPIPICARVADHRRGSAVRVSALADKPLAFCSPVQPARGRIHRHRQ